MSFLPPRAYALGYTHAAPLALKISLETRPGVVIPGYSHAIPSRLVAGKMPASQSPEITSRRDACTTRIWDYEQARCLHHKDLDPRLRGDDIHHYYRFLPPRAYALGYTHAAPLALKISLETRPGVVIPGYSHAIPSRLVAGKMPASQSPEITSRRAACATRIWDYEQARCLHHKDLGLRAGEPPALQGSGITSRRDACTTRIWIPACAGMTSIKGLRGIIGSPAGKDRKTYGQRSDDVRVKIGRFGGGGCHKGPNRYNLTGSPPKERCPSWPKEHDWKSCKP